MRAYRVYVGAIQGVAKKIQYSFCDPKMARVLVFSQTKPEGDFRVMKEAEQQTLSRREQAWLSNSRLCVAMKNASKSAEEAAQDMNRLMDILEQELKREKEALTDGNEAKAEAE